MKTTQKLHEIGQSLWLDNITRGLLAPSFVVSYSHSEDDVDRTIEIVDEALAVYASALELGVERFLDGRPVKSVYRERN